MMLGYLISKAKRPFAPSVFLAAVIGTLVGFASGVGLVPLLFPFYVQPIAATGLPEFRTLVVYVFPGLEIYREVVNIFEFIFRASITVTLAFIAVSVIGSVIGYILGKPRS